MGQQEDVKAAVLRVVESLKRDGFPKAIAVPDKKDDLVASCTPVEVKILKHLVVYANLMGKLQEGDIVALFGMIGARAEILGSPQDIDTNLFLETGKFTLYQMVIPIIREAIAKGMIKYDLVQELAVIFGAIPDPQTGWKYYRLSNGGYACWKCGSPISVDINRTGGEIIYKMRCPRCIGMSITRSGCSDN